MAKKTTKSTAATTATKAPVPEVTTTPVRNTTVPPKSAAMPMAKKSAPSRDDVRLRAYFIWQSTGGGEFENWIRAERELGIV